MTWRRGVKPSGWYPRRGEICLFALDKEKPALVITTDALNRFSRDVCIVPISKAEHRQFSLRPRLKAGQGGLAHDSWVKMRPGNNDRNFHRRLSFAWRS